MEGMTRAELDRTETNDFAVGKGPLRPRDAATLMLFDRSGGAVRVLMGRRSSRHTFMPGKLVFPGGRTDPSDSRVATADDLLPSVEAKLCSACGTRFGASRARAVALSAIRETYEEAGILIGERRDYSTKRAGWDGFADHGVAPTLSGLRMLARAITPPGRVRRFDTRFIGCWRDAAALELADGGPTNELEELVWLTLDEAVEADVPAITRTILQDISTRLAIDPDLSPDHPAPFYRMRNGRFLRDLI